jgi:hypothetical protein
MAIATTTVAANTRDASAAPRNFTVVFDPPIRSYIADVEVHGVDRCFDGYLMQFTHKARRARRLNNPREVALLLPVAHEAW